MTMYAWRRMTEAEREQALRERKLRGVPHHGPPHYESEGPNFYHLTAACYAHRPILGHSPVRMATFEAELVEILGGRGEVGLHEAGTGNPEEDRLTCLPSAAADREEAGLQTVGRGPPEGGTTNKGVCSTGFSRNPSPLCALHVWCVLPTHWHALVRTGKLREAIQTIGRLHGRASHAWNGEENARGRTCWHRCVDRLMRNEAHVFATINYILNNPVHHGYVARWQDRPYSNAKAYLEEVGEAEAARRWHAYPVLDYGKGWDEPGM